MQLPASPPIAANTQSSASTYVAPEGACEAFSMFVAIAKAAGTSLTTLSFTKAGYGLRDADDSGRAVPASFAEGRTYPLGAGQPRGAHQPPRRRCSTSPPS